MTLRSINCGVVTQPLDSVPRHDHMTPSVWGVGHTELAAESKYLLYLYCYEVYRVLLVLSCKSRDNFMEFR